MDDPSVEWSQERYDFIVSDLGNFLVTTCKYAAKDITYIPISGLAGENIDTPLPSDHWYKGPTLFQGFEALKIPVRDHDASLRIPIMSCLRDNGINIYGKVESGIVVKGQEIIILPAKEEMTV